jgi:restriction system protein
MSVKDAIIQALKEAGKPLHAGEITRIIIESGLCVIEGRTPDVTVSARIYSDIKKKGNASVFTQVGPRTFALRNPSEIEPKSENGLDTASALQPVSVPAITPVIAQESSEVTEPAEGTAPPLPAVRNLTFIDSAQRVLEQFGDNKPMHYREITKIALEKGWLASSGKKPEAILFSRVIRDIMRRQKLGELPLFVKRGRGYFGLSQFKETGFQSRINEHNEKIRKALLDRLNKMAPGEFEELVSLLLAEIGFEEVEVTKLSGDGGVDVRGTLVASDAVRVKLAVQAKRWSKNIAPATVQQVRGSLGAHEQGLIITTSDFSKKAVTEASRSDVTPIALMNGVQLVNLLLEHGIGVIRSTLELFEINEEFFGKSGPE